MYEFSGYLFSKLYLIGSKSKGPAYYLQMFDYTEIPIKKNVPLWKEDPVLQVKLGAKVTITGEFSGGKLHYKNVGPYTLTSLDKSNEAKLQLSLKPESNILWIDKMPDSSSPTPFRMDLIVFWPFRSYWSGTCPTAQIYDFFLEFNGKCIWQWSNGKQFAQQKTPVVIPGGSPHIYSEVFMIKPTDIEVEGKYVIRGLFIGSGQDVKTTVEVKFV